VKIVRRFAAAIFGGRCYVCRGSAEALLCAACRSELPTLGDALCPRCGLATPQALACGRCLAHAPHYDATVAALAYEFPADVLIQALKFRGELALAPFFADLLAERLAPCERIDLVVPVPLSARRLRRRGYNQAMEISRPLAVAVGAPLDAFACARSRDTREQAALPWSERGANVRGAFRCVRPLAGATVAVVDDVMTTGATLDEMAATLKRAGAGRVVNWVVARTAPPAA
jgi:ComF family protein